MRIVIDTSSFNFHKKDKNSPGCFTGINIFGYEVNPLNHKEQELFQLYAEQLNLSDIIRRNDLSFSDQIALFSSDTTWASLAEIALGIDSLEQFEGERPSHIRVPKTGTPDGAFIQALNRTFGLGITRKMAHELKHGIIVIHSVAINKRHPLGHTMSMTKAIDILLKASDITGNPDVNVLAFQAYPLQYFSKREKSELIGYGMRKRSDLTKDTRKLMDYYESIGFNCMRTGTDFRNAKHIQAPWLGKAVLSN